MTPAEALQLCRLAKAAFPSTAIDEFTPDAWALALEDDQFSDAKQALKELMREQPFIHVSEVVQRIKRIRRGRISDFGVLPDPPSGLTDAQQAAWIRSTRRRIADGLTVEMPALPPARPMPDLSKVLSNVDDA